MQEGYSDKEQYNHEYLSKLDLGLLTEARCRGGLKVPQREAGAVAAGCSGVKKQHTF